MTKIKTFIALTLLISPILSYAASMIESRDNQGSITKIYLQGDKARIEMPNSDGFAVMDVRNRTMQIVMHKQRMVMDLTRLMKGRSKGSSQSGGQYVDSYLKSRGLGPKIAGYETEQQEIYADGQYCGSVFVSVRAMNELDLRRFAHALENIGEQIQESVTGISGVKMNQFMDKCTQAEKSLLDQMIDLGFPLKSIDGNRRLQSVVTKLVRNTKLPANAFVVPKHYTQTTPAKMMQDAMGQSKRQAPDNMQNMMNNLPPEAQEMMRQKMKQMQQQYQQ